MKTIPPYASYWKPFRSNARIKSPDERVRFHNKFNFFQVMNAQLKPPAPHSLYGKYFCGKEFLSAKHIFSGYDNVRRSIYRHQYIGRRFLDQRLLSSSPIPLFSNDTQKNGAGSRFLYLTLSDCREFQRDSFSDRHSFDLTHNVTHPTTDRMCSFFLRSI